MTMFFELFLLRKHSEFPNGALPIQKAKSNVSSVGSSL